MTLSDSAGTGTDSWVQRLAEEEVVNESLNSQVDGFKAAIAHHGGVQQFLMNALNDDQSNMNEVANKLKNMLPSSPAPCYAQRRPFGTDDKPFLMQLWFFAFNEFASLQAAPFATVKSIHRSLCVRRLFDQR